MDYTKEINGHTVEFYEYRHTYLVDGVLVPSVSQLLAFKFPDKFKFVDKEVLRISAEKGTAVHEAIERYCKTGEDSDLPELSNFKFLQKHYKFAVLENEKPITIFQEDIPVAVGRLDMVIQIDGKIGGADIKRTATLDKQSLLYQLNLYRIGYRQCYGVEWEFLKAIHLKDDIRKFVDVPINEDIAWDLINDFRSKK